MNVNRNRLWFPPFLDHNISLTARVPPDVVQATIMGIVVSMCFLFLSFAKPLPGLSAQRPYTTILCPYFFLSVLAQFAVHLTLLVACVHGAQSHMPLDVRPLPHPASPPALLAACAQSSWGYACVCASPPRCAGLAAKLTRRLCSLLLRIRVKPTAARLGLNNRRRKGEADSPHCSSPGALLMILSACAGNVSLILRIDAQAGSGRGLCGQHRQHGGVPHQRAHHQHHVRRQLCGATVHHATAAEQAARGHAGRAVLRGASFAAARHLRERL